PVFGALLDCEKGGYFRLGPVEMVHGAQEYRENSMTLETRWELRTGGLALADVMPWPKHDRPAADRDERVLIRHLRCSRGKVRCICDVDPAWLFQKPRGGVSASRDGYHWKIAKDVSLQLWCDGLDGLKTEGSRLFAEFELAEGEELWMVLSAGGARTWTREMARKANEETERYWRDWSGRIQQDPPHGSRIRRAAMTVHLLTYAPEGSVLAAPTTSVPERIGGGWNADYRLCWMRDASLALGMLARLGIEGDTEKYLQWLTRRCSAAERPLQVLYGLRGERRPRQHQIPQASGYRDSQPVSFGNHAFKQHQLGSLGFLTDCIWLYARHGGPWREEYWQLVERAADHTCDHWREPENGVWELPEERHFVYSKVLSWVALDRALKIAREVGPKSGLRPWERERETIFREVMRKGWSERLGAFKQHYDAENLDAGVLLISVLEFLPGDHPRMLQTLDRLLERLTIDGWVYRFDPKEVGDLGRWPMGQMEGSFLLCNFWMSTALAKAGRRSEAETILQRAEKHIGNLGLLPEGIDARDGTFLGNFPLLFSQVEYVRARLELDHSCPEPAP
ncbi:MAG TPA: glycoside hydrolase family 15 protein, partial [Verrucomicrobiae bacterium]|nr:glycoside hydrolase family 15 protein [Verrucomicrobiae bacterium]